MIKFLQFVISNNYMIICIYIYIFKYMISVLDTIYLHKYCNIKICEIIHARRYYIQYFIEL